jgi:hypothetical protein
MKDYLWVNRDGEITLFENIMSPPEWGQHGKIISINRERKRIHFVSISLAKKTMPLSLTTHNHRAIGTEMVSAISSR